jgi:uncharacterized damage-inducible protein DinB
MASLEAIREKLTRAQTRFFRAADLIAADRWEQQPGPQEWSAAELVGHLVVVERGIIGRASSITQKTPLPVPFRKRLHLPLWFVKTRVVRRESPVPQDPSLKGPKQAMLGTLGNVREQTLAFLADTERRNLRDYCWRHPFLGMLDCYQWMEMIAAHQIRHTKQIRAIGEKLSRKL